MNRLDLRVVRLEQHARRPRPRLSHEDALAELDADPRPPLGDPGFSDEELDAEWTKLVNDGSGGR